MQNRAEPAIARSDWHLRARVRIIRDHDAVAAAPPVTWCFREGEEYTLVQWGLAGQPVSDHWWTSQNTDTAHTVPDDHVTVLKVIEKTPPTG
ncbi:hypothetical protein PUR49_01350 [Streptomyces sp. BE147]|uniref:hypothetical protein n=1 Tax=Streptomyces sp. BE147 TaxID=3002524 RepID=UPI002E767819|nr:hypothetical protein [Streptomyces sp. BE147]MEE1735191.1 hypothetical protein [Streptomyces sp. BE147]